MFEIELSKDKTYHIYNGKPLYYKRFIKVQSYHYPAVAAVVDESGAYHIDLCGNPLYSQRYIKTYGYYENVATVVDSEGYTHIDLNGKPLHEKHFPWAGNFQDGLCVVRDWDGTYYHIDKKGRPAYEERYAYAGDFRHGIAVVYDFNGYAYHIDKKGRKIHNKKYFELYPYHKGAAVARDKYGYLHVDENGNPLYKARFRYVEDFYNDYALAWEPDGSMVIIDRKGNIVHRVTSGESEVVKTTSRKLLMKMLVGYWDTKILYAIAKLGVLDYVEKGYNTIDKLSSILNLKPKCLNMIMNYLKVKKFIKINKDGEISLLTLGKLLSEYEEKTLKYAALMWGDEHYLTMHRLYEALISCEEQFSKIYKTEYYNYLSKNINKYMIFIRAMNAYSDDYLELLKKLNISKDIRKIVDIGGGSGLLLLNIIKMYPHIEEGIIFDRPETSKFIVNHPKIKFIGGNFLEKIDIKDVDAAIMSRVLHDWPDSKARVILCNTNKILPPGGRLYLLELIQPEEPEFDLGVSLDFNLLVMLGSKERTLQEFTELLHSTGFKLERIVRGEIISLIEAVKSKECIINPDKYK